MGHQVKRRILSSSSSPPCCLNLETRCMLSRGPHLCSPAASPLQDSPPVHPSRSISNRSPLEARHGSHQLQECCPAACPALMDPAGSKNVALALVSCGRDVRLPWSQGSYVRSCLTYRPPNRPGLLGGRMGRSETVEPSDICLYMSTQCFQFSKIDCTSSGPPCLTGCTTSAVQRPPMPDLAPILSALSTII